MGTGSSPCAQSACALHPAPLGVAGFVGLIGLQGWEGGSLLPPAKLQGAWTDLVSQLDISKQGSELGAHRMTPERATRQMALTNSVPRRGCS